MNFHAKSSSEKLSDKKIGPVVFSEYGHGTSAVFRVAFEKYLECENIIAIIAPPLFSISTRSQEPDRKNHE